MKKKKREVLIFDTNVLLSAYRLPKRESNELMEFFEEFSNILWIPHQVHKEFLRLRNENVIKKINQNSKIEGLLRGKDRARPDLSDYNMHPWIDRNALDAIFDKAFDDAWALVGKQRKSYDLKNPTEHYKQQCKELDEKFDELLEGHVGRPYSTSQYLEKAQLAKLRLDLEIPPGYKSDKGNDLKYRIGDVILWYQIMDHIRDTDSNVTFVTREKKKDWWEESKAERFRSELFDEFLEVTRSEFFGFSWQTFYDAMVAENKVKKDEEFKLAVQEASEIQETPTDLSKIYQNADLMGASIRTLVLVLAASYDKRENLELMEQVRILYENKVINLYLLTAIPLALTELDLLSFFPNDASRHITVNKELESINDELQTIFDNTNFE